MALSYRLGGSVWSRLEGEAEPAEVVVEPEDGGGAALSRRDRADAVGEREHELRVALEQVPRPCIELGVGVADQEAAGVDRRLEELAERKRCGEARVETQARRGLRDDEIGREENVAGVPELPIVVADALVRTVSAPQEGDEGAGVRVDDPQAARSLGAP
jgi:hypothetical protein